MTQRETPYLTISEAARLVGVSPSSLRNWERIGLISPVRSRGRYRLYSREVLKQARRVRHLRHIDRLNPPAILRVLQGSALGKAKRRPAANGSRKPEPIGARLSRLRRQQNLTLTEAARRVGLSPSFLSAVERGQAAPSVASFQKLAQLYGTNVLSFFGGTEGVRRLVRPRERKVLQPEPGIRIEQLAVGETMMEVQLWRIAPGTSSGGAYLHEGEEFMYILQGRLEVWLDEIERYLVGPGDSLYFASTQAHRWTNPEEKEAVVLWVNTPPSF